MLQKKELKIFGFGIIGQGFYGLDIEELVNSVKAKGPGAVIKVIQGNHSVKMIEAEFKYWVDEKCPWVVKAISESEYFVTFLSQSTMLICTRSREVTELALSKI
jgi:hypothetical protein